MQGWITSSPSPPQKNKIVVIWFTANLHSLVHFQQRWVLFMTLICGLVLFESSFNTLKIKKVILELIVEFYLWLIKYWCSEFELSPELPPLSLHFSANIVLNKCEGLW